MRSIHELRETPADGYQMLLFTILGAYSVRRYHSVPMLKDDTLASHSFGVAWLCHILSFGTERPELIMAALSHDLAEQLYGDIPSPAKHATGTAVLLTELEENALKLNHAYFELTKDEKRILELADLFEGMLRCVFEFRLGNKNAVRMYDNYMKYVYAKAGFKLTPIELNTLDNISKLWTESFL